MRHNAVQHDLTVLPRRDECWHTERDAGSVHHINRWVGDWWDKLQMPGRRFTLSTTTRNATKATQPTTVTGTRTAIEPYIRMGALMQHARETSVMAAARPAAALNSSNCVKSSKAVVAW